MPLPRGLTRDPDHGDAGEEGQDETAHTARVADQGRGVKRGEARRSFNYFSAPC